MNRLESIFPAAPPDNVANRLTTLAPHDFADFADSLDEAFFTPQHFEENYRYPLVVWLHGQGGSERQLASILPGISTRNFVGAAARGTIPSYASPFAHEPPSIAGEGFNWRQSPEQIEEADRRVVRLIDGANHRFSLHPRRIFLAGQGSGGTMALRLALNRPHQFAGAISIGGGIPTGNNPLRELHQARDLPVFLASGAAGIRYQTAQVCDDLRLLHTAGIPITLRQYPCADEVHAQCLHDMNAWMMECLANFDGAGIIR